jgi:hypothetical protein
VPVADAWKKDKALYRLYTDAVEQVTLELKTQKAKPAMKQCIDLAVKFQLADPRTRLCERWLAANYGKEFHVVEEIVPPIGGRGPRPAEDRPFTYDGMPLPAP